MKRLLILLIAIGFVSFGICVKAETVDIKFDSGELQIPSSVENKLEDITINDYEGLMERTTPNNIFTEIIALFKSGFKKPFATAMSIIALLIVISVLNSFKPDNKTTDFVLTIGVITLCVLPSVSIIEIFSDTLKALSIFEVSFIPVFAGIIAAKGKIITASNFSGLMLLVSEGMSYVSSFVVIPMSSMQMSLGIGCSFSKEVNTISLSKSLNKCSMWILSIMSALFLGVLSIQSIISSPADGVSAKAVRFAVGTAVPVVGNVVSEALGTFAGSIKLLSSSAAVYGVIVVFLIMLPIIVDILLWKFSMTVCRMVAETLSLDSSAMLINTTENCFSLILGIATLVLLIFVISVAIICAV